MTSSFQFEQMATNGREEGYDHLGELGVPEEQRQEVFDGVAQWAQGSPLLQDALRDDLPSAS